MRDDIEYESVRGPRRWMFNLRRRWEALLEASSLLRQLVNEPLFLAAVLFLALVALAVGLMVPKVWTASPPHATKIVRVSLLDYLQAWNLRRTARRAAEEGRWDESIMAWRSAIGNNQADPESHRGLLLLLRDMPSVRSSNLGLLAIARDALLELGRTNRADSLLVADVLERYRLPDWAIETLRPWETNLTPAEEVVWLRSLLTAGRADDFAARWEQGRDRFRNDPVLSLYRAALDAVGPPEKAVDAIELLRSRVAESPPPVVAARLLCLAALRREDPADYERGLVALRATDSAMVQDEAGWWRLLARIGRRDEAVAAASSYRGIPPATPMEVVHLVRAWSELGLQELALRMLRDHGDNFGSSFDVWAAYIDLLVAKRDWDEIRRVAGHIRAHATARDEALALSFYGDAVADLSEDRRTSAKEHLRRLLAAPILNPMTGLRMASGLVLLGEFETSGEMLDRLEPVLSRSPDYWLEIMANAQGRRDLDRMGRAADRLLALQPDHVTGLSVRLGLMLLRRNQPAEALALSLQILQRGVNNAPALINHASALLQNRRTAEAGQFLRRLDPDRLSAIERAAWQMASTEALAQDGRYDDALALGTQIDTDQLTPPDAEWLRSLLSDCRRRAKPALP